LANPHCGFRHLDTQPHRRYNQQKPKPNPTYFFAEAKKFAFHFKTRIKLHVSCCSKKKKAKKKRMISFSPKSNEFAKWKEDQTHRNREKGKHENDESIEMKLNNR
jgi:hypothetical protein